MTHNLSQSCIFFEVFGQNLRYYPTCDGEFYKAHYLVCAIPLSPSDLVTSETPFLKGTVEAV